MGGGWVNWSSANCFVLLCLISFDLAMTCMLEFGQKDNGIVLSWFCMMRRWPRGNNGLRFHLAINIQLKNYQAQCGNHFWSKMSDKRVVLMILGRWKKKDRRQDKVWLTVLETSLFALCPIADLFSAFLLAEKNKMERQRKGLHCLQPARHTGFWKGAE